MVLTKKIKRTILEHKAQYIGSIILIIISSMLFSSFIIAGINVKDNLIKFRETHVVEDANFILQQKIENIEELEAKYNLILEERKSYDYAYNKDTTLRILDETEKINKYAVVEGNSLKDNREILIDLGFAKAHDLAVNSTLKIEGSQFKIAGFMTLPDYTYPLKSENEMLKNPDTFGVAVISEDDFSKIGQGYTFYNVKFNQDNKEEFKKFLTENNLILKWLDKKENNRISFIEGDINGTIKTGEILPVTILLLTIVLVSIILWRLLKTEFVQIGTLYALGYRKREIITHYLSYSAVLAFVGATIGTILGGFLVEPLLYAFSSFYNLPVLETVYHPVYLVISFILPFVFLLPATLFIILKVLRMPPLELMRGGGNKTKINIFERNLKLNKLKFKNKFRIREIVRNIPRTSLMILGVTFASMLLLLGFATKDSMDFLIDKNYKDIYQYNNDYIFNSFQTEKPKSGEKASFSPFTSDKLDSENSFLIYGIEKDARLISLNDLKGNKIDFTNVIITKAFADKFKVNEGDTIEVENKLNSKKFKIEVNKIADSYLGEFIYLPLDEFNQLNGYPDGSYLELMTEEKLNIDDAKLISVTDKNDVINGYKALIEPLRYMIGMIAATAFVIGLIVIYIVTSLMIEENKNNISLFKVLGYSKKELYSLILNSNTILVITGYLISIPLLLVSMDKLFASITAEMNITIPIKLNYLSMLIGFVIIFATYEISKLLNKKKITKVSMADSLKIRAE